MSKPRIAKYEFSEGARFQSGAEKDPNAVGQHLEMLRKKHKGELTPEDVLADAQHNNSPLHSFFEWSDTDAAREYRLQQARGLIRSVVAVYVQPDKPAVRTKAYIHVPERSAPHYRDAAEAMSLTKTREMVLKTALAELQAWKRRYRDLKEFASLISIIDTIDEESLKEIA